MKTEFDVGLELEGLIKEGDYLYDEMDVKYLEFIFLVESFF